MLFAALYLLMVLVVGAHNTPIGQKFNHCRMVTGPALPVPYGIAVKIAG